ncbi:uncharacterized protein KY384_008775 [Bacidia gigantensis]|uniref:uncharacterized protein n=1 Tax=Bacidia gigantensis TaxID=2732470 RepID=UPI001D049154|nr:uncharacterized protein KY384_008775 [Bacidia gigantensis]KAG8526574.1 hypothetical protein KY384_008775 [Bacidia gigantensis]
MTDKPSTTAESTTSPSTPTTPIDKLNALLTTNPSIEFLRFHWLDYSATVRTRLVSVRCARALAVASTPSAPNDSKSTTNSASSTGTISVASPMASAFLIDGSFHEVHAGKKDHLVPDWDTLNVLSYAPGHAGVMCAIDEGATGTEEGLGFDPRSLLVKAECDAEKDGKVNFLVGVEIEFYLHVGSTPVRPVVDVTSYCSTASLRTKYGKVLEDAVRWTEAAGVPVWTAHSELVDGLFEINLEPLTPVKAADAIVYVTEAIKSAAVAQGLRATMHPKPFDKTHGVGMHLHISLQGEGREKSKDDGFLAGVLDSVPGICAISMPGYDSYLRADFAGGEWVSWDTENRMCSVRKIRDAYWEFRFVDATANPYLALAAILGTGMKAWKAGRELKMKPVQGVPPAEEERRKELGVEKKAPGSLKEAVEALEGDGAVKEVLGEKVVERFVGYKRHEESVLAGAYAPGETEDGHGNILNGGGTWICNGMISR